ncbi:DUF6894 family protein [Methylobacterium planeticum]|uniref:DUF6894 domain-containing protein n=1 Tax=Methylobacterium planeticum TaxID=2615211 RepID=A0A6N6MFH6_9HYPH|nr:hypothetical protein [Methylobacterium planeticum]KAB1069601.1 hypothetical protein F6X51_24725 [Methylobacterium planeticum]
MARFFFDVYDPRVTYHDPDGVDCPDRAAVSEEALRALCEIAADEPGRYVDNPLRIEVRDAANRVVMTASVGLTAAWHAEGESAVTARDAA